MDRAHIHATLVLNGAFLDMLGAEMPLLAPRIRRVLHWGDVDQPMDFTSKDDTAAVTAAVALDADTPRVLRVAGDTVSARDLASTLTELTGHTHRTLRLGSTDTLGRLIRVTQVVAEQPGSGFPAWQGMQYLRDMSTGDARLGTLDNHRLADHRWTTVRDHLARFVNHQ